MAYGQGYVIGPNDDLLDDLIQRTRGTSTISANCKDVRDGGDQTEERRTMHAAKLNHYIINKLTMIEARDNENNRFRGSQHVR